MGDAAGKIRAVADWLDANAENDEQRAKINRARLPAFADACAHDAREARRAARDLRAALATLTATIEAGRDPAKE